MTVVDKISRFMVKNLFITGSSVFRTSGHCHPTFTIVQLSLRHKIVLLIIQNQFKVT